jgi:Multiubiquitin
MNPQANPIPTEPPREHPKQVTIHIDRDQFRVAEGAITGAELRNLPSPPIGPDRDLYLEVKGPGDDRLIEPSDVVEVEGGMHFFTAPATITPGDAR